VPGVAGGELADELTYVSIQSRPSAIEERDASQLQLNINNNFI
jgi:hypothetical protein